MNNALQIFEKLLSDRTADISDMFPTDIGCLQLMLVGCKSAISSNAFALSHATELQKHGFHISGNWVYDNEQVRSIQKNHPDLLPDDVHSYFQKTLDSMDDITSGLLLGMPYGAIKHYHHHYQSEKTKHTPIGGLSVNMYGHCWIDAPFMSMESIQYMSKCVTAMEGSGLVKATLDIIPDDWREVYTCSISSV